MPPLLTEYVLKGVYLGLLIFVALQRPDGAGLMIVAGCMLGGLLLALAGAGVRKLKDGYRIQGRLPAFLLFLILESPRLIYAGLLLGLTTAALSLRNAEAMTEDRGNWFVRSFLGGAVLGVLFSYLQDVKDRRLRIALALASASAVVGGALIWFQENPDFLQSAGERLWFGLYLLLGIPFFYLLTFSGLAEESEVEIAAMCAALGLALWMLLRDQLMYQGMIFLVPLAIYYVYTVRILPGLRVFKHAVRGLGFAQVGAHGAALGSLHRALELDPTHALARNTLWQVHGALDLDELASNPLTLKLVNFELCLERAGTLLLESRPSAEKLSEAQHLLDLVERQRADLRSVVDYWRAVAWTHARQLDQAAEALTRVLQSASSPARATIEFPAWQLALLLHPELNRRVGTPLLSEPGRRFEAIAAVERRLAQQPDDTAWDLKRILYAGLAEEEFNRTPPSPGSADFDAGYAEQLGLALIGDAGQWQRGAAYLRMAAYIQPQRAPTWYHEIAQAHLRAGDAAGHLDCLRRIKHVARAFGPDQLPPDDRARYFTTLKQLADDARTRDDVDAAIENYLLYAEYERSGLETRRLLADLHERKGDVLAALRATEQGLVYDASDKDLLERKDRYYYSVQPDVLRAGLDSYRSAFNVDYCLSKARTLLDRKDITPDLIDWASHLAELALVVTPESITARVLRARAHQRSGNLAAAQPLLEAARTPKPERFASSDEEEAWFLCCRLLGDLYLYELNQPEQAIACYQDYRQSAKSGADTSFKLGQAYERTGDNARAVRCYEQVVAFDGHPRARDAREALDRLKAR